jgi:hypothetical protein
MRCQVPNSTPQASTSGTRKIGVELITYGALGTIIAAA